MMTLKNKTTNSENLENLDTLRSTLDDDIPTMNLQSSRSFPNAIDGRGDRPTKEYSKPLKIHDDPDVMRETDEQNLRQSKLQKLDVKEIISSCADAIQDIKQFETERSEINAEITSVREKLETMGISKKALAMAISVSKMTIDQMDGFDLAYSILRRAIAMPIQDELFDQADSNASKTNQADGLDNGTEY